MLKCPLCGAEFNPDDQISMWSWMSIHTMAAHGRKPGICWCGFDACESEKPMAQHFAEMGPEFPCVMLGVLQQL